MKTALLLIDIQNDYFPNGCFPLPNIKTASETGKEILTAARNHDIPAIHIRHEFPTGKGPFLCENTKGVDIHESVLPLENETVITKQSPNSFHMTDLNQHLKNIDCNHIVIVGAMAQMCVDATTRAALDLGYKVTICADGIASQNIDTMGVKLDAHQVKVAFLSALAMAQARIVSLADIQTEWH